MLTLPTIATPRLTLRPYTLADATPMQALCDDKRIAINMPLPHPYALRHAEEFINKVAERAAADEGFALAIIHTESADLIGSVGCHVSLEDLRARFGYWIGVPFWGRGFATEAAEGLVHYLFTALKLHRVNAVHYGNNPASGRVMQKLGMTREGTFRQHVRQNGTFIDDVYYGLLRDEWLARSKSLDAAEILQ